jgi:peptide/nickel transport system permease protein
VAILGEVESAPRHRRTVSWGLSSPTARYTVSRVLSAIGTFFFVLVFNFFLFRVMPGDPIALYTRGRNVDAEQIEKLRAELNRPLSEQFLAYITNPFTGSGP